MICFHKKEKKTSNSPLTSAAIPIADPMNANLEQMLSMGYTEADSRYALSLASNNIGMAIVCITCWYIHMKIDALMAIKPEPEMPNFNAMFYCDCIKMD
jgi:hypothetical protein